MKRVSGTDALFLSMENTAWPQHTAGLVILDPSSRAGFDHTTLLARLEDRLRYLPEFRRRVQNVPLRLDRPVWVDDPGFSLKAHVHRAAVPAPGGPQELGTLVGNLLAHPLDRARPLWEAWYLEGLEGDRAAILLKQHHAMVDGISGAGLSDILCDLEEHPARLPVKVAEAESEPNRSAVELIARGALSALQSPPRVVQLVRQTLGEAVTTISHLRRDDPPPRPMSAPRTSFNGVIGRRREFAYGSLPLDDVKRVKKHFDATVNDVVLSVVSGALRRYLLERDELPERSLLATVPMSTRTPDDKELGNAVHPMVGSIASDIEDPVARLAAIHRSMNSAKDLAEAQTTKQNLGVNDVAPPWLITLLFRGIQAAKLEQKGPLSTNLIISNVPGPRSALYLAGARIEHIIPVGPLAMGMGINVTVFSYQDVVDVGIQVDPALVEDPWALIGFVKAELDQLTAATRRKGRASVARR
jgi:diacylglycerol O-acyltransferase / wax synthase